MNWKKPLSLALAVTMLAGCGSSNGSTATGSTGEATGGSAVTVAFDADLNSMDYEIATDGNSFIMQSMCIGGLVQLDASEQPQPDLAESWEVSEDGLTYTFHLREGMTWSNGTPLTAADFVYGWQRLVNPDTASEYNFIMTTIGVVNAAAVTNGEMPLDQLGVEATDDTTFVVHLDQPCSFLLGLMAFPSFFPLNQEFYEAQGDQFALTVDNLIYCGPYTMTGWEAGNEYEFTKNPGYWNAEEVSTDTVTFRFIQDTQSAMLAYQQGDIDVVKLTGEQVDAYKDQEGYTSRLTGYGWRLEYNLEEPTINNVDLREAITWAIDRDAICDSVLKDGSVPATSFIPRKFTYGPDGKDYYETQGDLVGYDPERAAAAYEKAKAALGGDVTVTLLFEDSEASKAVSENIKSEVEAACPGITVNLDSKPKKTRLELMTNLDFEIGLTRWGPDYADPQTFMDLYYSDLPGYSKSYFGDAYNALMLAAETTDAVDPAKRWQDMQDAEKILVTEDYVVTPVYQNGGAMMINPAVTGIEFHAAGVDSYRNVKKS